MVMKFTAALVGHDTLLTYTTSRRAAYLWVVANASSLVGLEVDCGLNRWFWTRDTGWVQITLTEYRPGKGVLRKEGKPIVRGNGYDALHPWRFCLGDILTPNPLCTFDDVAMF